MGGGKLPKQLRKQIIHFFRGKYYQMPKLTNNWICSGGEKLFSQMAVEENVHVQNSRKT